MRHFTFYPKIEYGNNMAINILVRGKIRDKILQNTSLYYKYSVSDGERFDIISHKYYGNSDYVWAIFYANNIIDPSEDIVKPHNQFISYIKSKYGSVSTPSQTVHHYEYTDYFTKIKYKIDKDTYYKYLSEKEPETDIFKNVRIVTQYEYEDELNEKKRDIVVLDKRYLINLLNELEVLFQ